MPSFFFLADEIHTFCKLNALPLAYSNLLSKVNCPHSKSMRVEMFSEWCLLLCAFPLFPFHVVLRAALPGKPQLQNMQIRTWKPVSLELSLYQSLQHCNDTSHNQENNLRFWHANETTNASRPAFVLREYRMDLLNSRGFSL